MTNDETSLVPTEGEIVSTVEDYLGGERGLQHRGPDGLMLIQRQWLQELLVQGSWRKACTTLEIKERRVRGWLTDDESFSKAYDDLFSLEEAKLTRRELELMSGRAAGMYDEALEAERGLRQEVICPKCHEKFTINYTRPDWRIRLRAGDTILRSAKILQDTREIKGTLVNINLTGDEAMALLAIRAGRPVPDSVRAHLRAKGIEV